MTIRVSPSAENVPGVSGQSGKFLTTDGKSLSWGSASGMTLLTTTTFDNTTTTYTYSSLGSYKHIYIIGQGLTHDSTGTASLDIRFNSDTGSNYNRVAITGDSSSVTTTSGNAQTSGYGAFRCFADNNDTSLNFGSFSTWIPDYNGSGYKSVTGNATSYVDGTAPRITTYYSTWNNTAAITSITLFTTSVALRAGIIKIYGVS